MCFSGSLSSVHIDLIWIEPLNYKQKSKHTSTALAASDCFHLKSSTCFLHYFRKTGKILGLQYAWSYIMTQMTLGKTHFNNLIFWTENWYKPCMDKAGWL